jgi:hypothetical protein
MIRNLARWLFKRQVDEKTPDEVQEPEPLPDTFIQYVIPNKEYFRGYLAGKNQAFSIAEEVIFDISSGSFRDLHDAGHLELQTDDIEEAYALEDKYNTIITTFNICSTDQIRVLFQTINTEFCSTLINNVLPDGQLVTDKYNEYDLDDQVELSYMDIIDYLRPSYFKDEITQEHLDLKVMESESYFVINCDKCGTPHHFDDMPEHDVNCTLCDKPLLIYLEDNNYEV